MPNKSKTTNDKSKTISHPPLEILFIEELFRYLEWGVILVALKNVEKLTGLLWVRALLSILYFLFGFHVASKLKTNIIKHGNSELQTYHQVIIFFITLGIVFILFKIMDTLTFVQ